MTKWENGCEDSVHSARLFDPVTHGTHRSFFVLAGC